MLEMLLNFERYAVYLNPTALLSLGIAVVATGLVLWLAGMALRKLFLFVAGAVAGAIIGLYFVGRKTISAAGLAALCALAAAFFNKLFVTILAAAMAVLLAVSIMAWHYDFELAIEPVLVKPATQLNQKQTIEFIAQNIVDFAERMNDIYRRIPNYNWLIVPLLIVVFVAAGIFCWNLICAWLFATAGTIFIFAGMISLLLYKGSAPVTAIFNNGNYYAAVFSAMMLLGTIVQLLLFHHIKSRAPGEKTKSDNLKQPSAQQGWRGL